MVGCCGRYGLSRNPFASVLIAPGGRWFICNLRGHEASRGLGLKGINAFFVKKSCQLPRCHVDRGVVGFRASKGLWQLCTKTQATVVVRICCQEVVMGTKLNEPVALYLQ